MRHVMLEITDKHYRFARAHADQFGCASTEELLSMLLHAGFEAALPQPQPSCEERAADIDPGGGIWEPGTLRDPGE